MLEVPKTIFFYWEGSKLSWLRYMTLYSFRILNPNWKMELYVGEGSKLKKTWVEHNQSDFFIYDGKDYLEKISDLNVDIKKWKTNIDLDDMDVTPPQASDFFQWQRLNEGGIYSDMDILYVRSIDEIYDQIKSFDIIFSYFENYFTIGFLGSRGRNHFWEELLDHAIKLYTSEWFGHKRGISCYQAAGVSSIYYLIRQKQRSQIFRRGRKELTDSWDILIRAFQRLKFFNLNSDIIYPWNHKKLNYIFEEDSIIPEETIGIHWYGGSEVAQEFNNYITPKTVGRYNNTLCQVLRRYLQFQKGFFFFGENKKCHG